MERIGRQFMSSLSFGISKGDSAKKIPQMELWKAKLFLEILISRLDHQMSC